MNELLKRAWFVLPLGIEFLTFQIALQNSKASLLYLRIHRVPLNDVGFALTQAFKCNSIVRDSLNQP